MRYDITHKVDARYISVVDAKSTEKALELAKGASPELCDLVHKKECLLWYMY